MKKLAYLLPLLMLLVVVAAPVVFAAAPSSGVGSVDLTTGGNDIGSGAGTAVTNTEGLIDLILGLVNWVAWFVALVAVLFGLYAGILFITAGGDDEKLTKAKNILLYSIVGIVVAILAFSIVAISRSIAGV
jgi:hypothetical protein